MFRERRCWVGVVLCELVCTRSRLAMCAQTEYIRQIKYAQAEKVLMEASSLGRCALRVAKTNAAIAVSNVGASFTMYSTPPTFSQRTHNHCLFAYVQCARPYASYLARYCKY